MDTSLTDPRCPRCGAAFPPNAPLGACPACLLGVAAGPASELTDGLTSGMTDAVSSGQYVNEPARFAAGDTFGSYRIVGLLGRGGMGEVYEALDHDGRRVALKLLRQRLTGTNDRDRFLREGVLAASIAHRNCVYVYGSEEIDGVPVIAMELAPQGTLKHAVEQFGPRTPVHAVTEILQVVAGLEAAAAAGILHRDVKPSNCFIDADGAVKVGDFGLSVSLNPSDRDIAWKPTFQGTPEFAAPEQLKGEPLDLRADIYSVGATLFFLLTGYSPFGERNIKKLIELKTTRSVPTVDIYLPGIPAGLVALVGRCMSPDPDRRPQTYADLTAQLRRYVSPQPAPASMLSRWVAMIVDSWAFGIFIPLLTAIRAANSWDADRAASALLSLLCCVVFERTLGGTPGQLMLGIRVIDVSGRRPSVGQAAVRWTILLGPQMLLAAFQAYRGTGGSDPSVGLGILVFQICSVLYSSTRSDSAMFHDAWTGTRAVRSQAPVIAASDRTDEREPVRSVPSLPIGVERVGPFEVIGKIADTTAGDLLLGRDARLGRFVWIQRKLNASGALSSARRQLSQPTRLRWLAGDEAWDAFEAPDGRAFDSAGRPESWRRLSVWLADLARDLEAAEASDVVPTLSLDRLWLLADGRVMLLDFRAPGAVASDPSNTTVPVFLARLADSSRAEGATPRSITLAANALRGDWMTTRAAAAILQKLSHEPLELSRWRRALPILVCALPAIVFAAGSWLAAWSSIDRFDQPDAALRLLLQQMTPYDTLTAPPAETKLLRQFVAESFRADLTQGPAFWNTRRGRSFSRERTAIEHTARWFTPQTPQQAAAARAAADEWLRAGRDRERARWPSTTGWNQVTIYAMDMTEILVLFAIVSFATAFVSAPFLFRNANLALHDHAGLDAGLARRVVRAIVTWSPLFLIPVSVIAALGVLAAGAVYAVVSPERSIQDRLAGTFVAPR